MSQEHVPERPRSTNAVGSLLGMTILVYRICQRGKGVNEGQTIEITFTRGKSVTSPPFLLVTWVSRGEYNGRKPEQYARSMPHCTGGASVTMSMYSRRSQTSHRWHRRTVNRRFPASNLWGSEMSGFTRWQLTGMLKVA